MSKLFLIVVVPIVLALVVGVATETFADARLAPPDVVSDVSYSISAPSPNLPRGALSNDQSAFALGSMQWNVVFVENDGSVAGAETWDAGELALMQTEIAQAETYWEGLTSGFHPGARLSINVNYPNAGAPLTTPLDPTASQNEAWINDVMTPLGYTNANRFTNVRDFNQAERVAANTHWSTTIFAMDNTDNNNDTYAYAYLGGPYTILTQNAANWGPQNFSMVLAHEMGHIFFGLDEYASSGAKNTDTAGYLNGVNGNASLDGSGNLVTPPYPNALMLNNGDYGSGVTHAPSPFSTVQFGHLDTDSDLIPDILDTVPTLTGNDSASDPLTGDFIFSGSISVNDVANNNPLSPYSSNSGNDMTINTIGDVFYELDGGAPVSFAALDGAYDDYTESLGFTLSGLAAGAHIIDVFGINSVGNASSVLNFTFNPTAIGGGVPEPSTLLLVMLGLLGVGMARLRSNR